MKERVGTDSPRQESLRVGSREPNRPPANATELGSEDLIQYPWLIIVGAALHDARSGQHRDGKCAEHRAFQPEGSDSIPSVARRSERLAYADAHSTNPSVSASPKACRPAVLPCGSCSQGNSAHISGWIHGLAEYERARPRRRPL